MPLFCKRPDSGKLFQVWDDFSGAKASMFSLGEAHQIGWIVIGWIIVGVMDVVLRRNLSMMFLPNLLMHPTDPVTVVSPRRTEIYPARTVFRFWITTKLDAVEYNGFHSHISLSYRNVSSLDQPVLVPIG